jgi:uncharacterized OB-fold protein
VERGRRLVDQTVAGHAQGSRRQLLITDPAPLPRPLPVISEMNRHFWQGGADGRLHIMRCSGCGLYFHPYQACCSHCGSTDVGPSPVSGRATVVSTTINHQPWFPHVPVPYVVALVELEERGPVRLVTNMFGVPVDDVLEGMPVMVHFEQQGDIFVPLFRPI